MTASLIKSETTAPLVSTPDVRFHLSLNVGSLDKAIAFFRVFFGIEPAKCRPDYAKFELSNPPLVLSLEPYQATPGGNLNHLGFRMPDSESLVELQRRLELAGIRTVRECGVECCYARQTKFWVHDPDGNMWEVYTVDEDLEHRGDARLPITEPGTVDGPAAAIWNHRLGQAFPAALPIMSASVDVVSLQGTFNDSLSAEERQSRYREVRRVLKPGGKLQMHMLTADRPLGDAKLALAGQAAAVRAVPVDQELLAELAAAGFQSPQFSFRAASPCFRIGEAELRETRISAQR